jgi:hydroxymethylglutaryl-CoA synthase
MPVWEGESVPSCGIVAYGTALPQRKVATSVIAQAQERENIGATLGVQSKTVPARDEDTITLSTDALQQALQRLTQPKEGIGALFIGSESHPYAVKPSGSVVAQALGLSHELATADLQFACKAGTQAVQIAQQYVLAGTVKLAAGIGTDTAQGRPGDVLEFTAGAGSAAYVLGSEKLLAEITHTASYATDTPDFWRRPKEDFPEHAGRFTAEPGYFHHITTSTQMVLSKSNTKITEYAHCVFHTPNGRFPVQVAKQLGCTTEQLKWSLPVKEIGNTYAAASLLALASVLDHAKAGEKILVCSYGSGSGADSMILICTKELEKQRKKWSGLLAGKITELQDTTFEQYSAMRKHT